MLQVRLRGGPTPLEGYVEVMGPGSKWGSVCDLPSSWTVEEASIVCRMLGYQRYDANVNTPLKCDCE